MTKQRYSYEIRQRIRKRTRLFEKIKENEELIRSIHYKHYEYAYEDRMYRFYHASLKTFWLQDAIDEAMKLLKKLNPHRPHQFDNWFIEIIEDAKKEGEFKKEYNKNFSQHARPVVEAYLHCKYFLDMLMECLKLEEEPNNGWPSKWAALTELYNIRY